MDILYLLIPLSVVLVFLIGAVLWFAVRSGQFENLDRPDFELLADDDSAPGQSRLRGHEEGANGEVPPQVVRSTKIV